MSYGQKEMARTAQQILGDFQRKTEQHSRVIFFTEIQKSNDSEYKQDSLCTMLSALGRHLWQVGAQFTVTSVDAKHHGASLWERWNVTWVGNNSICTH